MFRKAYLWLVALVVAALGAAGFAVLSPASAAARPSGSVVVVGSTADCSEARQWYMRTDGSPNLLHWCGEAPGANAVHYRDAVSGAPLWLRGVKLDVDTTAPAPKPTTTATPTASTTSSPSPSVVERAPVLSSNGATTEDTARLKWTNAKPDAGETIAAYVVESKFVGSTWGIVSPDAASPLEVGKLVPNTAYVFRVRAEFASGVDGLWSNELTLKTTEAAPVLDVKAAP